MTAPGGQEIEPGKAQKVVVSISTRYAKGDYSKEIEVETNDPQIPIVKLTMKATVVEILSIVPVDVDFGAVRPGSVNRRQVTIVNHGKEPITITEISANPAKVLSISPQGAFKLEPGKLRTIELRFQPGQGDTSFFGILHVETDHENIKANARIRARIERD